MGVLICPKLGIFFFDEVYGFNKMVSLDILCVQLFEFLVIFHIVTISLVVFAPHIGG